jgi:hypothetical protein
MKCSLFLKMAVLLFFAFASCVLFVLVSARRAEAAQKRKQTRRKPADLYDKGRVPVLNLPDLLTTLDGRKVNDAETWSQIRRPEILKLFETHVYGRTMIGRPSEMTWKVKFQNRDAMRGKAVTKRVTIYFTEKIDGPKIDLNITLPANEGRPVPVFLIPGPGGNKKLLLHRGYGLVNFDPRQIEPDIKKGSYVRSIRKVFAKEGQNRPEPDEWGAIGAWAWGMSRAMDYIETDPDIDAGKVCIMGFSRFGKVAMWAGAQDERFAITFSGGSGCGGAVILRRRYGESIEAITGGFPHWFSLNFKKYADKVNDLPVDWHMLVALMAPRPVYIATAADDHWGDPYGSFLSAKYAGPVYKLFGKVGVGADDIPAVDEPVGDFIGYHNRRGGHSINNYDWKQFLAFADRHLGIERAEKSPSREPGKK